MSINSFIAHNTYTEKDDYELKDNDIVRIELAVILIITLYQLEKLLK